MTQGITVKNLGKPKRGGTHDVDEQLVQMSCGPKVFGPSPHRMKCAGQIVNRNKGGWTVEQHSNNFMTWSKRFLDNLSTHKPTKRNFDPNKKSIE